MKVAALLPGFDDDTVDDFAERLGSPAGVVGMAEGFGQAPDPAPVVLADIGMDVGQIGGRLR
jgi:hypothetical protein